jgi:hypothetical protein
MYTFSLVLTHADSMNEFRVGETFEQLTVVSIWKMKHKLLIDAPDSILETDWVLFWVISNGVGASAE